MLGMDVRRVRVLGGILLLTCLLLTVPRRAAAAPEDEQATALGRAFLTSLEGAKPEDAWQTLLAKDTDPWIVVEQLLLLGEPEAATRLAKAPLTADARSLSRYAERGEASMEAARALARAGGLLQGDDAKAALAALPATDGAGLTVTAVRALLLRADIEELLEHPDLRREALQEAALRAEALGWARAEIAAREAALAMGAPAPGTEAQHLERLLAIDRDARDLARSAAWATRLGALHLQARRSRTALRYFTEADALLRALARSPGLTPAQSALRARTLAGITSAELDHGRAAPALDAALEAEALTRGAVDPKLRVVALQALINVLWGLRRHDDAILRGEEALAVIAEHPEVGDLRAVRIKGTLARLRLERGETDTARRLYEEVLASPAFPPGSDDHYVARLHLAAVALDCPSSERTQAGLQEATLALLRIERDATAQEGAFAARAEMQANARALRGRALNLLGRHAEAANAVRAALETDYVLSVPPLRRFLQLELADALLGQGRAGEALDLARSTWAAQVDDLRALPDTLAIKTLSDEGIARLLRSLLAAARASGDVGALRDAVESSRGAAFLAEVRRRRLADRGAAPTGDAHRVGVLAAAVGEAARRYWTQRARRRTDATREAADALWQARLRLRAVRERAALQAADQAAREGAPRARPTFVRKALKPGEAMLYVVETPQDYVAVVVRRGETHAATLGPRAELDETIPEAIAAWREAAAAERDAAHKALVDRIAPPALRALLGPDESKRLPKHVYVSVAGVFARVPWGALLPALVAGDAEPPTVSRIASQAVLRDVRVWSCDTAGDGPMLVLADPQYRTEGKRSREVAYFGATLQRLDESAEEGRGIRDAERGDVLLMNTEASEPRLRAALLPGQDPDAYPFDVLHMACHGLLYRHVPWLSALALHPAPGEDGLLTVDEIGDWRFRRGPGLVVLSACDSGLGAPVAGEGEEGLVRAFLLAGTRHVVASLWKVPDGATKELMLAFHRLRRDEGLSPVVALRKAQAHVRAMEGMGPNHWAAWTVWGPRD